MKTQQTKKVLSSSEALKFIKEEYGENYSISSIYRLLDEGKLKGFKRAGRRKIYLQSIRDFFCPNFSNQTKQVCNDSFG